MSTPDENIRLTPTSYIVLGCLSLLGGQATPYQIKRLAAPTIGPFWPFPHSQLYAEPDRLAQAGYATMRREASGRRRKTYKLTPKGRTALSQWRSNPTPESFEYRDPAIIKLFFGADPSTLAPTQIQTWRAELHRIEDSKHKWAPVAPPGPMLAADYGIQIARAMLAFWSKLAPDQTPKL